MRLLLTLFFEFFKTGLFAVGGGLATIPFLYNMIDKYQWFSDEVLGDMIAISESTPGPIGVNMATYSGYHVFSLEYGTFLGMLGGIFTTFGLILPSFIVILFVSRMYQKFKENRLVQSGFYGIRPVVVGMIGATAVDMFLSAVMGDAATLSFVNFFSDIKVGALILFVILLILTNKFKKHPIIYIILAGVVGGIFKF
ncbi:MAG: chromate transporter [Ruminococcaceae bacterium]|nr:chromate transporter [Oscillospiraceae bacterium]